MPPEEAFGLSDLLAKNIVKKLVNALARQEVKGSADNGAVSLALNGRHRVTGVSIASHADGAQLGELVAEAINDALSKWEEMAKGELKKLVGDIPLLDEFI